VDGFFDRLWQRKIVQWALAYLAGAFALLQAVDIVGQRFGWPEQVERVLIVALGVGFFVVLVLAWYHGERGEQRVSGTELSVLALLLAIGGAILWRVATTTHDAATTPAAEASSASALGAASTAVLPFVNMSADKANEYFSDGMTETLLNRLAQVPQLKVARARRPSASRARTPTCARSARSSASRASSRGVSRPRYLAHHRAVDPRRRRRAPVVAQLRPQGRRPVRDPGRNRRCGDGSAGRRACQDEGNLAKGGTKDLAAYDGYTRAWSSSPSTRLLPTTGPKG
jgi:hypothetical protein